MTYDRRDIFWLLGAGTVGSFLVAGCEGTNLPTQPQTAPPPSQPARMQPYAEAFNPANGSKAILKHHGYATSMIELLDAMRGAGLDPRLRLSGLGKNTYELNNAKFGWVFLVNNRVFEESDASRVILTEDVLWAAYEKSMAG